MTRTEAKTELAALETQLNKFSAERAVCVAKLASKARLPGGERARMKHFVRWVDVTLQSRTPRAEHLRRFLASSHSDSVDFVREGVSRGEFR